MNLKLKPVRILGEMFVKISLRLMGQTDHARNTFNNKAILSSHIEYAY